MLWVARFALHRFTGLNVTRSQIRVAVERIRADVADWIELMAGPSTDLRLPTVPSNLITFME